MKLACIPLTPSSDYTQYLATAHALAGDTGFEASPQRILKPLAPATVALLAPLFGSFEEAFLFQALAGYLLLIVCMYVLAREFLKDEHLAILTTLLSALSYPILKYGVDLTTETVAIALYCLSLFLTLRFLKKPRLHTFWWNVAVVTIAFFWKEYAVVSGAAFGIAILLHPSLTWGEKIRCIGLFGLTFGIVHALWQTYVYLTYHYTYFSWYQGGGAPGFSFEYTAKNLLKSTAALLGVAWLFVPHGLTHARSLETSKRRFLLATVPPPFMAFAWGYVSSRLFYVIAPPFLLLAGMGLKNISNRSRYLLIGFAIAANITWLFLSYSVTL